MQTEIVQTKKTHWPSILILGILAIGILFFLGIFFVRAVNW
jgi:hypothetical protein